MLDVSTLAVHGALSRVEPLSVGRFPHGPLGALEHFIWIEETPLVNASPLASVPVRFQSSPTVLNVMEQFAFA
jgi:hypothetical protein